MNDTQEQASTEQQTCAPGACLCSGVGPAVSDALRRLGPPPEARRHFEQARVEILKGLRALIDARIDALSHHETKGTRVTVE